MKKLSLILLWVALVSIMVLAGCNVPAATQAPPPTPEITSSAPSSPAPAVINPSVEIVGDEELVYDWSVDRCADEELPDLPVRAFRDARGSIQLNLSWITNYRMIGEDLDSLKTDCQVTLRSDLDGAPSHYRYSEWMGSTYTLDGTTVYALVHNEFYGYETSGWYAARDFGSSQDEKNWRYQAWNGSSYANMGYDVGNNRWQAIQRMVSANRIRICFSSSRSNMPTILLMV